MNRSLMRLITMMALLAAVHAPAATLLWSAALGQNTAPYYFSVDQIVADGSGGGVVVADRGDNDTGQHSVFVWRFDSKGEILWNKVYADCDDIEISYVDKKFTVFNLGPSSGNETVHVVDSSGADTALSEAGSDVYCDVNSEIGPTGDKKGFFVIVYDETAETYTLRRYSYK